MAGGPVVPSRERQVTLWPKLSAKQSSPMPSLCQKDILRNSRPSWNSGCSTTHRQQYDSISPGRLLYWNPCRAKLFKLRIWEYVLGRWAMSLLWWTETNRKRYVEERAQISAHPAEQVFVLLLVVLLVTCSTQCPLLWRSPRFTSNPWLCRDDRGHYTMA